MEPLLGQIQLFPYNFTPEGWLFCEGQLLNIENYTALYALVGTQFGGNGIRTFAIPDLKGKEPIPNTHYCIAVSGSFPNRA